MRSDSEVLVLRLRKCWMGSKSTESNCGKMGALAQIRAESIPADYLQKACHRIVVLNMDDDEGEDATGLGDREQSSS